MIQALLAITVGVYFALRKQAAEADKAYDSPAAPWDALVNQEAGPGHSEPLRPKRPVSLD